MIPRPPVPSRPLLLPSTTFPATVSRTMHRHVLKCRPPIFSSVLSVSVSSHTPPSPPPPSTLLPKHRILRIRTFATAATTQSATADAVMESLQEMYATAKDEFEIAAEETERKTVYAADDRAAAREALTALQDAYQKSLRETSVEVAHQVQGRVGQRIRELESAVLAMEERAKED